MAARRDIRLAIPGRRPGGAIALSDENAMFKIVRTILSNALLGSS